MRAELIEANKKIASYIGYERYHNLSNCIIKNNVNYAELDNFFSEISEKMKNIIDLLEGAKYLKNSIRALIIAKCLRVLDDKSYFDKHIGDIKRYDEDKIREDFEKIKPFLMVDNINIRVPINPNYLYFNLNLELENIINFYKKMYKLSNKGSAYDVIDNLVDDILKELFDKERKAKLPKPHKDRMQYVYDTFKEIIVNPQCDRTVTDKEKSQNIKELQSIFPKKTIKL